MLVVPCLSCPVGDGAEVSLMSQVSACLRPWSRLLDSILLVKVTGRWEGLLLSLINACHLHSLVHHRLTEVHRVLLVIVLKL